MTAEVIRCESCRTAGFAPTHPPPACTSWDEAAERQAEFAAARESAERDAREQTAADARANRPSEIATIAPEEKPFSLITGPAGSGKSHLSRAWAAADPSLELTASTGIAAINMGGAVTINSLLRYFDTANLRHSYLNGFLITQLKRRMIGGMRQILLDECSMVSGDQLTILVEAIDETNRQIERGEGGVKMPADARLGLTLVGDFCQLPPVDEPFAFDSPHWGRFGENVLRLTRMWRQDDPAFIEALRGLRRGEVTAEVQATFEPCMTLQMDESFDGTTIVAKNVEVDRVNRLRFLKLPGASAFITNRRQGEQRSEWKTIPEALELKVGALVMLLANDPILGLHEEVIGYNYANGDLAHVVEAAGAVGRPGDPGFKAGAVTVELVRNGETHDVLFVTREIYHPEDMHKKRDKRRVLGWIHYMPLRLAYATTVHKSQGLSLDRVQVSLINPFVGQPAMVYVALSRARTLEGLRIVGTAHWLQKRTTVAEEVRAWL